MPDETGGDLAWPRRRYSSKPREAGGFGAKHEDGKRVVVAADTQKEVIERTKAKFPDAEVHVARVRDVGPGPDKYRKA